MFETVLFCLILTISLIVGTLLCEAMFYNVEQEF
jgi:hypothetical protein